MCFDFIDVHTLDVLESEAVLHLNKELMVSILQRDSLYDGLEEVQLYLAALRWARGYGTLDYSDEQQFSVSEISDDQLRELREILKYVRIPLIPADIIIQKIHP